MIVRHTRQAIADLDEARARIALDRPRAAQAAAARIREAIEGLRPFPGRGRTGRAPGTRELAVPRTPSVVPHRIAGREIQMLAVLHGARLTTGGRRRRALSANCRGATDQAPGTDGGTARASAPDTPHVPAVMSLMRPASDSIENGFVSTCMPGPRWPWFSTAFSA